MEKSNEMKNKKQIGVRREGSPYSDQECEEIIDKLEQLLDGELDVDREKDFLEKVNNCQYCLEQYKIEKSFRSLIKKGFQNVQLSSDLVQTIKAKIDAIRSKKSAKNTTV